MAEKPDQLLLDALSRAAANAAGLALHGNKAAPGLFGTTAPARQAAQHSKDQGYLHVVRTETRGKTTHEICALTEKGLAYLLSQVSPKRVLEDFIHALEDRRAQVGELASAARQIQTTFDAIKAIAEKVLEQIGKSGTALGPAPSANGSVSWMPDLVSYLAQWHQAGSSDDCPLPALYRQAQQTAPSLTIGHFHDGLRELYDQERIYLHPWTGPLYEMPEPALALLAGHEVAYYASLRQ